MTESVREEEKKKGAIIKENFQQMKEEIKDKTGEEMEIMQTEMNSKKVNIYNALENLFQRFMNNSKDKFKKYTGLLEENTTESRSIDETMKKITRAKEKIKLMSLKVFQMEKEFEEKNNQIKSENEEIGRNFLELKNKMFTFRNEERRKLTRLSCCSKKAVEELTEICKLGERILKYAELCRRLEYESEKILPFYATSVMESKINEEDEESDRFLDKNEIDLLQKCEKFNAFENFFKKFNKAFIDKMASEHEHKKLVEENQVLKQKLSRYLEGLTVTTKILNSAGNPLFSTCSKPLNMIKENLRIKNVTENEGKLVLVNQLKNNANRFAHMS